VWLGGDTSPGNDLDRAIHFLEIAADAGNAIAQFAQIDKKIAAKFHLECLLLKSIFSDFARIAISAAGEQELERRFSL
jgi:hypothetical protein